MNTVVKSLSQALELKPSRTLIPFTLYELPTTCYRLPGYPLYKLLYGIHLGWNFGSKYRTRQDNSDGEFSPLVTYLNQLVDQGEALLSGWASSPPNSRQLSVNSNHWVRIELYRESR